ncbi:MAG: LD-carboxypeptidase [Candidatus Kapabacteria bacterium]|nr:LD-carboxypeptidase [Candidatus Kapabacteria bacterium]
MIKPKALRKNATIGIVTPASPLRSGTERLNTAIRYLEQLGYRIKLGNHVYASNAYLAGTDAERMSDIEAMFADPTVDAIICSRGGYGTMRYLAQLNYRLIKQNPKIFVGFSDTTALQSAIYRKAGLVTFSGAMVGVDVIDFHPESEEFFWRVLTSKRRIGTLQQSLPLTTLHKGTARGHLVCGNLAMLTAIAGTPFQPNYKNAILLCEDIGEESYRIDRMLSQLELQGALRQSAGLLFGQFTEDKNRKTSTPKRPIPDVLTEYAQRSGRAAIGNVMYGHTRKKLTLPFGVPCSINAGKKNIMFPEAVVE